MLSILAPEFRCKNFYCAGMSVRLAHELGVPARSATTGGANG